jgi:hypothetical protein
MFSLRLPFATLVAATIALGAFMVGQATAAWASVSRRLASACSNAAPRLWRNGRLGRRTSSALALLP